MGRKPTFNVWSFILGIAMTSHCLTSFCWADTPQPEPIITSLNFNKKVAVDLEIIQWPDGSYSLPVKYVAELLDLSVQQTPDASVITFTDPVTSRSVRIDSVRQQITHGDSVYEKFPHPIVKTSDGLFSQNDLYISQDLAATFFGVTLALDKTNQTVQLSTDRPIKLFLRHSQDLGETDPNDDASGDPIVASQEPDTQGHLLEAISLNFNSSTYQESQIQPVFGQDQAVVTQYMNLGSTLDTDIQGHLFKTFYSLQPQWGYRNGQFGITDIQWRIQREGKRHQLDGGSMVAGLSPLVTPFVPLWGVQFATRNATETTITPTGTTVLCGEMEGSGIATLQVNGIPTQKQRVTNNHYCFETITLQPETMNTLRVVQNQPDGSQTVLQETYVPYYTDTLRKGESAYSTFLGRTPLQFYPLGMGFSDWKLPQSNKWVAGGRYYHGLTDRLTLGVSSAMDTILGQPQTSTLNQLLSQLQSADLTGYTSFRQDPNTLSGASIGASLHYRLKDHWTLSAHLAQSLKKSHPLASSSPPLENSLGMAGQISAQYQRESFHAALKAYHYGTDYYTPVTIGIPQLYDRQGISLEGTGMFKGFLYQSKLEHYLTNLSSRIDGGIIQVNRWNGSLSHKLGARTDLRLSTSWLTGENEEQLLGNRNIQIELNQQLPWGMQYYLGYRRSNNRYLLNPGDPMQLVSLNDQTSLLTTVQSALQIPLPRGLGQINLGGSMSKTLNLINLQGNIRWKHLLIEPALQTSLASDQKLLTLGLGLYYEWANGRRVGLRYNYTSSTLPSLDVMLGASQRQAHEFQINFTDTLAFLGHHLASIGKGGNTSGMLEGEVFLDLNQDGKLDRNEPGVPRIPMVVNGKQSATSDNDGRFFVSNLSPGIHSVTYDYNQLPINLTPTSTTQNPRIAAGKRTKVALGVIITPGNLSGAVQVKDGSGKTVSVPNIVVSLVNAEGKEAKFTYTDEHGHYSITEVPPGKYTLRLDPRQVESEQLKVLTSPETVTVPIDYEGFYDKMNLNFDVIQLMRRS